MATADTGKKRWEHATLTQYNPNIFCLNLASDCDRNNAIRDRFAVTAVQQHVANRTDTYNATTTTQPPLAAYNQCCGFEGLHCPQVAPWTKLWTVCGGSGSRSEGLMGPACREA
jgi:hypothetical protein